MASIQHKRGTRAQINAAASSNQLKAGELYLITDEDRLAVGTGVNTYQEVAKDSELFSGNYNDLSNKPSIPTLPIAQSDVTNLVTDLGNKSDTSHNHSLNNLTEKSYNSLTDKPVLFSGSYTDLTNKPAIPTALKDLGLTRTTQSNLTCNFASYDYIVASISANASFSLSNVPTDRPVTVLIKNTSGSAITITLPNTADMWSAATYDIDGNGAMEFSIVYDGTTRYWQVSEVLT